MTKEDNEVFCGGVGIILPLLKEVGGDFTKV
jgi:hypothetical protein